jgi:hypothetical protein
MTNLRLVSSVLLSLALTACITDKEVGLETESGEESESAGSSDPSTTDGSTTSATESGSSSAAGTSDSTGGTTTDGTSGSDSESESDGESSGGTTSVDIKEPTDQDFCEDSGGVWDPTSCGHYFCGAMPDCAAIDPGCDCGVDANFISGEGCVESIACDPFEFGCGPDETCTAPDEFCDVFIPGVKGAETTYTCAATPMECTDDYTCDCLEFDEFKGECTVGEDGSLTVTIAGA